MRTTTAKVGNGKAIHALRTEGGWAGTTLCVTNDSDLSRGLPIAVHAPAITCKPCLKALAVLIEEAHAEAIEQDASMATAPTARVAAPQPSRRQRATARRELVAQRRELARRTRDRAAIARRARRVHLQLRLAGIQFARLRPAGRRASAALRQFDLAR